MEIVRPWFINYKKPETNLIEAVKKERVADVRTCLENGADPHMVANEKKVSALHLAAYRYNSSIVELLCIYGADPTIQDIEKKTPLHWIAFKDNGDDYPEKCMRTIETLINYGADIEIEDRHYKTPLYIAVQCNNYPAIQTLLIHKADVNCKNNKGFTPLHCAAEWGYTDIIKLLLVYNAQPDAMSNYGVKPIVMAQSGWYDESEILISEACYFKERLTKKQPTLLRTVIRYLFTFFNYDVIKTTRVVAQKFNRVDILDKIDTHTYETLEYARKYLIDFLKD